MSLCDLGSWAEALAAILTYASDDQLPSLCGMLNLWTIDFKLWRSQHSLLTMSLLWELYTSTGLNTIGPDGICIKSSNTLV